ncbi:E3 UFM1-protein ligase 1, partial [Modicella reniformis]
MASRSFWGALFGVRDNPEDMMGPTRLSEDACEDLVQNLVRLGYLTNVSNSLDGRSFITHEHLAQEILLQLEKRNGRISVLDLPRAVNANLSDIQVRVLELVRSGSGKLFLVQDELLKVEYLNNVATQLNEELEQQGYFATADLCRKYSLGIDFMRQFLKDRVGSVILGQWDTVDRGLVIAPSFLEKEKATLLKTLNELQEPTSLQSLRQQRVVQDQLFYGLCDLLSKEPGLPGGFRGTNDQGVFVPHPYEQQQTEWIETFFRNNGFIELDSIRKRGVADPRAYIQTNHPTALLLETHAVRGSIWSVIDASVEDTIANLSWIDAKPLLPSPLTKDDIASLLRQLPSLTEPTSRIAVAPDQDSSLTGFGGGPPQEAFVIHDSIVITSGQFQKCLLKMGPLLDRSFKALVSWRLSFGADQEYEGQVEDENPSNYGEGFSLKGLIENDMNAQMRQRKDNNSKRKGSQGGIKHDGNSKKQAQDFLTMKDLKEEILLLEPDFDPALVTTVAKVLHGDLVRNLKDRNRSVVLNQVQENEEEEEEVKDKQEPVAMLDTSGKDIRSVTYSLSKRIELSAKGINVFEDPAVKNSLSKHLLQSWCIELLDLVVLHLASVGNGSAATSNNTSEAMKTRDRLERLYVEHQGQMGNDADGGRGPFTISAEDTAVLLELVPQVAIDSLKKMRKLTAGSGKHKSMIEYLDLWSSLSQDPTLSLDDANDDRPWLSNHLKELHRNLMDIQPLTEPALMLHIVTLIAFQSWAGFMLHASGKFVPRILRQLRLSIEQQSSSGSEKLEQKTATSQLELLERMLNFVLTNVKQQEQQEQQEQQQQSSDDQANKPDDP